MEVKVKETTKNQLKKIPRDICKISMNGVKWALWALSEFSVNSQCGTVFGPASESATWNVADCKLGGSYNDTKTSKNL